MHKKLSDSVLTAKDGQNEVARVLGAMVGFVSVSALDYRQYLS